MAVYDQAMEFGIREDVEKFFEENKTNLILAGSGVGVAVLGSVLGEKYGKIMTILGIALIGYGGVQMAIKFIEDQEKKKTGVTASVSSVIIE